MTPDKIESRASDALKFLTDTDEQAAELKFEADKAEARYHATIDAHFLALEGSIEQRKAAARVQAEPVYTEFLEAQRAYDAVANRRRSEAIVVEWLRSLNANRRQGA